MLVIPLLRIDEVQFGVGKSSCQTTLIGICSNDHVEAVHHGGPVHALIVCRQQPFVRCLVGQTEPPGFRPLKVHHPHPAVDRDGAVAEGHINIEADGYVAFQIVHMSLAMVAGAQGQLLADLVQHTNLAAPAVTGGFFGEVATVIKLKVAPVEAGKGRAEVIEERVDHAAGNKASVVSRDNTAAGQFRLVGRTDG